MGTMNSSVDATILNALTLRKASGVRWSFAGDDKDPRLTALEGQLATDKDTMVFHLRRDEGLNVGNQ